MIDYFLLTFLLLLSSFFSLSETTITAFNRYRMQVLATRHSSPARKLVRIAKHPAQTLAVVLFGNTFANLAASSLLTMLAIEAWGEIGSLYATIILTVVVLLVCELIPKMIASMYADYLALRVVGVLDAISWGTRPFVKILQWIATRVVSAMGLKASRQKDGFSAEEFRSMLSHSRAEISDDSHDMLVGVLDLDRLTVNEVMQPFHEIHGIDVHAKRDTVWALTQSRDQVYWYLYDRRVDKPVGVVHVVALLKACSHHDYIRMDKLKSSIKPVCFVLERTSLRKQVNRFIREDSRFDLVVDEYGDIIGSIELQDIIEEVIGTMGGEEHHSGKIRQLSDGGFWVYAGTNIRALNRSMNWSLPDEGPVTVSGLIIDRLEAIPQGPVSLIINDYRIEVMSIMHNQIKQCRIYPPDDDLDDLDDAAEA